MGWLKRLLAGRTEPQWVIPKAELERIRRRVALSALEEKKDRERFKLNSQPE